MAQPSLRNPLLPSSFLAKDSIIMFMSRSEYGQWTERVDRMLWEPVADPFATAGLADRGVNTFSPEGRLFQVEYAIEAIKLGSTTVGIRTPEGVVLGVEKRVQSSLLESDSVEKIMEIDAHIGCAMSGLVADARTMIEHARVTAQNHAFTYDEDIQVSSLTQAVCDLALRFGESVQGEEAMMVSSFETSSIDSFESRLIAFLPMTTLFLIHPQSRPFGVALLIAGYDEKKGPQL